MEIPSGTKVTALWLITGKKLESGYLGKKELIDSPIILAEEGAIVRSSATKVVVVPPTSIVAVEVEYPDKKSLDEVMNG